MLQREARGDGVAVEHPHRLQRVLLEVLAEAVELLEQVVGDVMMWQPTWSACTRFRISRGEAQISSERGACDHDVDRCGP